MLSQLIQPSLLPYYGLVAVYWVVCQPHVGNVQDNVLCAILKTCPIWFLAFSVSQKKSGKNSLSYKNHFILGLLLSSLGDVSLEFSGYFELGVAFFGMAQILYLLALKQLYRGQRWARLAWLLNVLIYGVLFTGGMSNFHKVLIGMYSILIHTMLFFSIASYESYPSSLTALGAVGAFLFVLSDFVIAYRMYCSPVPYGDVIIMMTYYIAQVCLSSSVPHFAQKD